MERTIRTFLIVFIFLLFGTSLVSAGGLSQEEDLVLGGQLYDRWFAVLGVDPPSGEMPIWDRQSTNTRTGGDTWRCSECHGWDYKGVEGAYGAGTHYTGFPNIRKAVAGSSTDEIIGHLSGEKDPAHDFSDYIPLAAMEQLAVFLQEGLIDDSLYIDSTSLKVIGGDLNQGQQLYEAACAECHGDDGKTIIFRSEGVDEYLGTVASRDPWRFLHRTRFGVAGSDMPIGINLGWTPAEGRDVLMYSQTLPTGAETGAVEPAGADSEPSTTVGGPGSEIWQGILTGLTAFVGVFGSSVLFIALLLILIGIVVWALRR
jgi:thiosulfate dehydrogenase